MAKKVIAPDINILIIKELTESLRIVGEEFLCEILTNYRIGSGEDTLKALQEFNVTYNLFEEEEGQLVAGFLMIGDFRISYEVVKNFNKIVKWIKNEYRYGILLNEDPNDRLFQANKSLFFESEQQRDIEYAKLKKKLEIFNQKFK